MKCFTTFLAPGLFFAVAALAQEPVASQYGSETTSNTAATTSNTAATTSNTAAATYADNASESSAAVVHPTSSNIAATSSAAVGAGRPGYHGPWKLHTVVIDGTTYKPAGECTDWSPDGWLDGSASTAAPTTDVAPTDGYTSTTSQSTFNGEETSLSDYSTTADSTSSNSASASQPIETGHGPVSDFSSSSNSATASATGQPPYGGTEGSSSQSSNSASQTGAPAPYETTDAESTFQTSASTAADPSGYPGGPSGTANADVPSASATAVIRFTSSFDDERREVTIPVTDKLITVPDDKVARTSDMEVVSVTPADDTVKCQAFEDVAGRVKLGRRTKVGKTAKVRKNGAEKVIRAIKCAARHTAQQIA